MGPVDINWDLTFDFTNVHNVKIIAPDKTYTISGDRFIGALLAMIRLTDGTMVTEYLNVND